MTELMDFHPKLKESVDVHFLFKNITDTLEDMEDRHARRSLRR